MLGSLAECVSGRVGRGQGRGRLLTGHTVDGFEGPQDAHSADGRQVDVLEVQGVLDHPAKRGEESEAPRSRGGGATAQTSHAHTRMG